MRKAMRRLFASPQTFFLLLTLHIASNANAASGNPPTIPPRITMMTHGASEKCHVFFSADGKSVFVVPNDIDDKIAEAPKGFDGRVPSLASSRVQAVRDSIFDGSMIREKPPGRGSQVPEGVVVRGGERTSPVMLYDLTSGSQVARWGNGFVYQTCALSPDGTAFMGFAWQTGCLDIWDVASRTLRSTIEVSPGDSKKYPNNTPIEVTPDGTQIVVSTYSRAERKRVVRRYNLISGAPIGEFDYAGSRAPGMAISPDGLHVATNNLVWNMKTGRLVCELQNPEGNAKHYFRDDVAFTPDGKFLLAARQGEKIAIADLTRGTISQSVFPSRCNAFSLSPDGAILAASGMSSERHIRLYDFEARRLIAQLSLPVSSYSLCFSPDGQALAAGCYDGATRIWDVSSVHAK